jgi:hypothetical protein
MQGRGDLNNSCYVILGSCVHWVCQRKIVSLSLTVATIWMQTHDCIDKYCVEKYGLSILMNNNRILLHEISFNMHV